MSEPLATGDSVPAVTGAVTSLPDLAVSAIRQLTSASWAVSPDLLGPLMAETGRITSASLVEIVEVSGGRGRSPQVIRRARWTAGADLPAGRASEDLPAWHAAIQRMSSTLRRGDPISGPVSDLAEAGSGQAAGSAAIVPIEVAGRWWGALIAHDDDAGRGWPASQLDGLRSVATAAGVLVQTGLLQDRLAELRARYQTLVEQIPAILYIDLPQENRTAYVSPQIEPILGVTPQEWLGQADLWVQMLHPDDRAWVLAQYREFVENGGPHLTEYRMVRPDGRVVWLRDRAQAVRDENGQVVLEQGLMMDVTELKEAEATARRHASLLERVDSVSRQLTELVLQGGDPGRILRVLAGVAENPVLLEDAAHQLIDFASYAAPVDDVLGAWDTHSRVGHLSNPSGVMIHDAGGTRCAWIPLFIRGQEWGRLHVLELDSPIDDADRFPLDRAAAALSLALLAQRDAAHLSDQARSTLISDIARGRVVATSEILRRARGLGADLGGKTLAGLVLEVRGFGACDRMPEPSEHDRQRISMRMLDETRHAIAEAACTCLIGLEGDRVLALLGLPAGRPAREVLDQVGTRASARIESLDEQFSLAIGFSRPSQRPTFGTLMQEAIEAAAFGVAHSGRSCVSHFGDLGVHHLLARLADGPELSSFVESELSPLLDHDATAKTPLLPTLRAYLDNGARKTVTARALHLERRTLYYRIARIEKVLGRSLDDREIQLRCHLAIRGLEMLQLRSPSIGPGASGRAGPMSADATP